CIAFTPNPSRVPLSLHDALPISLVTGAGRGIGAGCAEALAADGWPVAVNYRADEEGARGVVERIVAHGGRAAAFQADMGHADERSEEHTSELQSQYDIVCRLLLE